MDLDEMLKQEVVSDAPTTEAPQIQIMQDGSTKEVVENETGDVYFVESVVPGTNLSEKVIGLKEKFETDLASDLKLLAEVEERVDKKKSEIKKFIEEHGLGSFKTNILNIKYSSATTTTTIDTTRFKKELPELAAKYSKVSSRASSISVGLIDTPKLAEDLLKLK